MWQIISYFETVGLDSPTNETQLVSFFVADAATSLLVTLVYFFSGSKPRPNSQWLLL